MLNAVKQRSVRLERATFIRGEAGFQRLSAPLFFTKPFCLTPFTTEIHAEPVSLQKSQRPLLAGHQVQITS